MTADSINPMDRRTVLITGASNGIGRETARALAALGANLILICRDPGRGTAIRDELVRTTGRTRAADLVLADLESQQEIRRAAADIKSRYEHIDVLVNNAANVFSTRRRTVDGLERTYALNHLAPFLLTGLLLDLVKAARHGRIVNVASEVHAGKLDWGNLQSEKNHQFFKAYQATKTENLLFTFELAHRLADTAVTVNAVSPGPSRTGFGNGLTGPWALFPKVMKMMPNFHSAEKGSRVVVFAAVDPSLDGVTGQFYMNNKPRKSKPITHSRDAAQRLWRLSEELTGFATQGGTKMTS